MKDIQDKLLNLDCSKYTEKKNNLTYLSWANAYREALKIIPDIQYDIIKDEQGRPYFGDPEVGYMVYTTVTVNDTTREMWLPVLDYRNKAIKTPDMFNINTSIMRCLTKNLAMFGLGTYIYAGEDLPEGKPKVKTEDIVNMKSYMDKNKEKYTIKQYIKKFEDKFILEDHDKKNLETHYNTNMKG